MHLYMLPLLTSAQGQVGTHLCTAGLLGRSSFRQRNLHCWPFVQQWMYRPACEKPGLGVRPCQEGSSKTVMTFAEQTVG